MRPLRTLLFVPGNDARRTAKALASSADAVILDLEDAVAESEKAAAREAVAGSLALERSTACYVRVNAWDTRFAHADLATVVAAAPDGIVLPKVEAAHQLLGIDWLIGQLERESGLAHGAIDLIALVETARGLTTVDAIAGCGSRARRLCFGAADFCLDTGIGWSADEGELDHPRLRIVVASRAAGLDAPIDTVWARLGDSDGLAASAERARTLGFGGKLCIHPAQLDPVNAAFSPSAEEIEHARRQVELFARAEAEGLASIRVGNDFVDYPIAERARRLLTLAGMIERTGDERRR